MPLSLAALIAGTVIAGYILIGYPLLLALRRGKTAPPVAKDLSYQPSVSIVMAVYNGEAFVGAKLDSILALDYPRDRIQIIVISDGSTDKTESIVRAYADRGVQLIAAPHAGKAAAINQGLARAVHEILFFTDVRQPLDRSALRHLAANFADPSVGAATGKLQLTKPGPGEQADMDLYWRYEVWARTIHSSIDSIFASTGCIYALRRSLAAPIPADTLSDDAVLPLRTFFKGYRVVFDPLAVATDFPALSNTEFRRRWRNLAGLWQVFTRMPELFGSRDRMRFHFLSHKLSRLILPWSLLLIVGASLALPGSWYKKELIAGDAALAALALVDRLVPERTALKRLTSPARTFVVMNAASLYGIAVFFTPAKRLWVPTRVETTSR
jgi:cellulose synthase/poly-beta-1,6-N-acetylglucosamine synthase-like glycosyltransferase